MRKSTDLNPASEHKSQLHTSAQTRNQNPEQPNWLTRVQVNRVDCEKQEIKHARAIITSKQAMRPKPTDMAGQGNDRGRPRSRAPLPSTYEPLVTNMATKDSCRRGANNRSELRYQNCQPIEVNLQRLSDTRTSPRKRNVSAWKMDWPHPPPPISHRLLRHLVQRSEFQQVGRIWQEKVEGKGKEQALN